MNDLEFKLALMKREKSVLADRIIELTKMCNKETDRADALREKNEELLATLNKLAEIYTIDYPDAETFARAARGIAHKAYFKATR